VRYGFKEKALVSKFHTLQTIGQERICTACKRRWDFDEAPGADDVCDGMATRPSSTPISVAQALKTLRRKPKYKNTPLYR